MESEAVSTTLVFRRRRDWLRRVSLEVRAGWVGKMDLPGPFGGDGWEGRLRLMGGKEVE